MTSLRRASHPARPVVPIEQDGAPPRPRLSCHVEVEATWLVSGRAVLAGRPELAVHGPTREVALRWTVRISCTTSAARFHGARAVLDLNPDSAPVELLVVDGRACPGCRIERDAGHDLTSVHLVRDGREVLLLAFSGGLHASDRQRVCELAYARTPILYDPPPSGLGVGGGRYEFAGVGVRLGPRP